MTAYFATFSSSMKITWGKDIVSFIATNHAGDAPGTQIKRHHPLSFCYRWAIIVVGALLFGYAFIRILFPYVMANGRWDGNFLSGLSAIGAMLAVGLVLWGAFYLIDRLADKHLNKAVLALMLIACGFCILSTVLFSIEPSWDYGVVLRSALELSRDGVLTDMPYFSRYPFQIYPLLYMTFFMKLIHARTMAAACGVSYVLSIVHILVALYGAFFLGKLLRGKRFGLKILLFCMGSAPLFLSASICYTDTLALPFPVWTLALWLYARKMPVLTKQQKWKKAALYVGSGMMAGFGFRIKSIAAIGLVALMIFLLFDRTEQKNEQDEGKDASFFWQRPAVKKCMTILLLLLGFLIILAGSSLVAGAVGYGDDDVHDDRYTYPLTHWFMMGANRETIGAYNVHDDAFTRSVPTYAERQKQTTARFVERLRMEGTSGYLKFLSHKLEAMLCTGNYQVGGKLAQHPLIVHPALKAGDGPLVQCYLDYQQAFQAVVLFSLLMGIILLVRKPGGWAFRLTAMMLIGVVLFLLLWEGKARYLLFLVPVINIAAVLSFCNMQDCLMRRYQGRKGKSGRNQSTKKSE